MECPACKTNVDGQRHRCHRCNYGIRPVAAPSGRRPPRYIGDKGHEGFDATLARTYRCTSCRSYGANVKRIATTGAGITRAMNWQCHEFIVASCHYCGLVQHFDPSVVDQSHGGWKALDFLFEI
ncbi:zinc ribbon domain-containing protein [Bremerella sp.]|uniref:zinc ribbon domain-containing protein n=1 Tax=Bremerella sp. TaxID=2795602 RepID=UPI003919656C